ncbi:MAG: hypothetical protein WC969_13840 [Elusimicrobiota bacterium]|jgi:hypothetical protein
MKGLILLLLATAPLSAETLPAPVAAEASAFSDQVLLHMGRAGVKASLLPRDFGPRLRLVVRESAGMVPGHFLAFTAQSAGLSEAGWAEVFGALREGPEAFAAFLRLKTETQVAGPQVAGLADAPAMPDSVKERWASGRSVVAGSPIRGLLEGAANTDFEGNLVSGALGGADGSEDSGAAVDVRDWVPATPASPAPSQAKSLKDLKPLPVR